MYTCATGRLPPAVHIMTAKFWSAVLVSVAVWNTGTAYIDFYPEHMSEIAPYHGEESWTRGVFDDYLKCFNKVGHALWEEDGKDLQTDSDEDASDMTGLLCGMKDLCWAWCQSGLPKKYCAAKWDEQDLRRFNRRKTNGKFDYKRAIAVWKPGPADVAFAEALVCWKVVHWEPDHNTFGWRCPTNYTGPGPYGLGPKCIKLFSLGMPKTCDFVETHGKPFVDTCTKVCSKSMRTTMFYSNRVKGWTHNSHMSSQQRLLDAEKNKTPTAGQLDRNANVAAESDPMLSSRPELTSTNAAARQLMPMVEEEVAGKGESLDHGDTCEPSKPSLYSLDMPPIGEPARPFPLLAAVSMGFVLMSAAFAVSRWEIGRLKRQLREQPHHIDCHLLEVAEERE